MKLTLSWLKEHLETEATLKEISETLTALGLEVESLSDPAATYKDFVTVKVEKAMPHPDADRLKVCIVRPANDTETVQVVCGAPNAREGMIGVFAPPGSYVPGIDTVLRAGKIRGVESNGMLVSEREMMLSDAHEGIIDLPGDTPAGEPFAKVFGLDDPVIEIAVTPNRADAAGVRGIARDLAAAGLGRLKPLDEFPVQGDEVSPVKVTIEDSVACPYFVGRYIKGVQNGPSPKWLQDRLRAIGLRPISALVDITNYISYDLCRPLHVFDADKLTGDLHVRPAHDGEVLEALDERTYTLKPGMTIIADKMGPQALAGVIGGERTACTGETVNVFVESAYFDPGRTARTGRDLQIISDARYRFERGVDPEFTYKGCDEATRMILEICGGTPGEIVQAGFVPDVKKEIVYDPSRTGQLGGVMVEPEVQSRILKDLGFAVTQQSETLWHVQTPSWRYDVQGAADLVEEVLRVTGYDHLPQTSLPRPRTAAAGRETFSFRRGRQIRRILSARGMLETVTWSFTSSELADQFERGDSAKHKEALTLTNPISSELDRMRPSVLPGLILAAGRNAARGYPDTALFEVGPVYENIKPDTQPLMAAALRSGAFSPRHWASPARPVDAFDAKADALSILEACGAPVQKLRTETRNLPSGYHPGQAAALMLGPNVLGYFGRLHPRLEKALDCPAPTVVCEVYPDRVPVPKERRTAKKQPDLPDLQPVHRDFAFLVNSDVPADDLRRAVQAADPRLIADVQIFDVYEGEKLEPGQKSLALAVTLQPRDGSLTEADLDKLSRAVQESAASKTGARLRQ